MRISDWSSDVCSSDLDAPGIDRRKHLGGRRQVLRRGGGCLLLAAGSSDQQDANEQSNRRHGGSLSFRGNGAHQFLRGRSTRPVTPLWSTSPLPAERTVRSPRAPSTSMSPEPIEPTVMLPP